MRLYKALCVINSLLFLYLFFMLLLNPESFLKDVGLQSCKSAIFISRRASIFMFGLSLLSFLVRSVQASKTRQAICSSIGVTLLGLAFMSGFEVLQKTVNTSMIGPMVIEALLGGLFFVVVISDFKSSTSNK